MNSKENYFIKLDNSRFKIKVCKGKWPQFILFFIIIWILAERFLMQLGISSSIIYLIDFLNVIMFAAMIRKNKWKKFGPMILAYGGLVFFGVLNALLEYKTWGGSFLFTIIEVRNVIRFPIFFLICVTFLQQSNIETIFNILTKFFYVNFVMILYQYITYHPAGIWTRGDYLNGFFGTSIGGNTYVNALMLCVVSYWFCKWCKRECVIWKFLLPLGISVVIAALIELKAYLVEAVILYIWYFFSQRKTVKELAKNIMIIIVIFVVAYFALQFMYQEYPWFRGTMSLNGIFKLTTDTSGYTGKNDLNRLTAIFTISDYMFKGRITDILVGIGLGNGAVYSLGGTFTKFCQMYESTHYSWFSSAYIFVQCGGIGLFLYIYSFIYLFIKKKNIYYKFLSQTMTLLALVLIIYNETLKTDAGYFVYFAIASGFISDENSVNISSSIESKEKKFWNK